MKKTILIAIIFGILIISLFSVFFINNCTGINPVAEIYSDGNLVKTISLNSSQAGDFTITNGNNYNTIHIENHRISVVDATCPDKLCIKQGAVKSPVLPIVCLPNGLVIKISDYSTDRVDVVAK